MYKRAINYVFLMAVYISGILIGGAFTPDVISYAKQISSNIDAEQQQKPQPIKKKKTRHMLGLG